MRQVVLDTETTGLEHNQGHRIIEIGCIELVNRRLTGSHFHQYLQPDREIDAGAIEVHGIKNEFLADKPRFADIAEEFLAFVRGAELIIHNAPFDIGFLNRELSLLGTQFGQLTEYCTVLDTLAYARQLHPGQRNNLDALCKRYSIDNSHRDLHGALLDAEILADVYLAMTGGQANLLLEGAKNTQGDLADSMRLSVNGRVLKVVRATSEEEIEHKRYLAMLNEKSAGHCLWQSMELEPPP